MKQQEIRSYIGKEVLIYVYGDEICYGTLQEFVKEDNREMIELKGAFGTTYIPMKDVLYMIERSRI